MEFIQNKRTLAAAILCTVLASAPFAAAQPGEGGEHRGGRHQGPPPDAIAACAGLEESASCSFTGRRGEDVQGSCMSPPRGEGELACAPACGPPPRPESED